MANTAFYLGDCINSFDADGECTDRTFPYEDATVFAQAEANYLPLTREEFHGQVPPALVPLLNRKDAKFFLDETYDLEIMYDPEADIHYFFQQVPELPARGL